MNYSELEYHWAREVIYLHSLWHRGPPTSTPNFPSHHFPYHHPSFSNPNPYFQPNPNPTLYYNDYPSSHLAPERSNKKQKRDSSPENEWPCDPASVPGQPPPDTWQPFEGAVPHSAPSPNSATRAALISMQFPAIQSCKAFFSRDSDSESDSESESEPELGKDLDEFFRGLFENDVGLRVCYEKDHEKGEFYCLVCEAKRNGNKGKGMVYRGCAALAQHANAARKVGQCAAHRAFARAICQVLGWDPQRLPSVVLLPGSAAKADHSEDKETGANLIPGIGARSPTSEVVPETGDSGTKKTSKGKDSDQEENPEDDVNKVSEGIVLKIVDFTGDREERDGSKSKEAINSEKNSGSPVEEKKEAASYAT